VAADAPASRGHTGLVAPASAGVLIALEGIDGCGKSTQAARLAAELVRMGLSVGPEDAPGTVIREPGGTPLGEGVREVLLHRDHTVHPWAEALLYAAARAQLANDVLRPALAAGRVLVLDRYVDSSLAYQGYARGLGVDTVLELNERATGGRLPDLSIVVWLPVAEAAARRSGGDNRIEAEGAALQEQVAVGYRQIAVRFARRIAVVDGSGPETEVAAKVLPLARNLLRRHGLLVREKPVPQW